MSTNVEKDSGGKVVKGQIKCYFVFRNQSNELQTEKQWEEYIKEVLSGLVEGPISYIKMQPK